MKTMTKSQQIIVAVFSLIILGLVLVIGFGHDSKFRPISATSRFLSQVFSSVDISIEGGSGTPECSDGVDNDNDGAIDFPNDFSCANARDNDERNDLPQCFDGQDNDDDGVIDIADAGCSGLQDDSEKNLQCADGIDNDNDGRVDYPADIGCRTVRDVTERNPRCSDGIDNDADNLIDFPADPGCVDANDDLEVHGRVEARQCSDNIDNDSDGYIDFDQDNGCSSSADNSENSNVIQCADGRDNDFDGDTDYPMDRDCSSLTDNSEGVTVPPPPPQTTQCSDNIDNDGDGAIDYPADPGCTATSDNDEFNIPVAKDVLQPGNGWGNTELTASGAGPRAIARWDVVPNQTASEDFHIGVIAFHKNGIDRVEFYADNGVPVVVNDMTLNPDTGVWEYVAIVRPSLYAASGPTEIRAIVYPTSGLPRILQDSTGADLGSKSLHLTINKNNTLTSNTVYVSPTGNDSNDGTETSKLRTIAGAVARLRQMPGQCSGAHVKLSPGDYMMTDWGGVECSGSRWLTVEPAAGVSRSQVNFVPNPNFTPYTGVNVVPNLRFSNVTFKTSSVNYIIPYSPSNSANRLIWLDGVKIEGTGFFDAHASTKSSTLTDGPWPAMFFTDVEVTNVAAPEFGTGATILMRNIKASNIGSDFSNNKRLTVNIDVDHLKSRHDLGSHPDFIQTVVTPVENMIVYNAKGTDIGAQTAIGGTTFSNVALVNMMISKHIGDSQVGMWIPGGTDGTPNHVLLWNIGIADAVFVVHSEGQQNYDFRGNVIQKMTRCFRSNDSGCHLMNDNSIDFSGWSGGDNHYVDTTSWAAITYGTPTYSGGSMNSFFRDFANYDFHTSSGSALANRISNLFVPADIEGREREHSTAIGPYRGTNEGNHPGVVNKRPVVNAGEDFPVVEPTVLPYVMQLTGTATDDGRSGSGLSYHWVNMDNLNMTFGSSNSANTSATFPTYGTYPIQLRVSDGQLTGTDEAAVRVVPKVVFTSPQGGTNLTGNVNISISTPSPSVASLKIYTDGTLRRTCTGVTTCSYTWNVNGLTGYHQISAEASDGATPANIGASSFWAHTN